MDFYDKDNYSIDDIESLINNEVEENIHLDYKRGDALSKDCRKINEISKDVSAFANSDGGIIVYGLSEEDHKPKEFKFVDGEIYTKEWLETKINDNIHQRINGVIIYPIRIDGDIRKTVYVVKIPRSNNAPHMASDHKYYRRFNFESVPMEEYEVRDTFHRIITPTLRIQGCNFYKSGVTGNLSNYDFYVPIVNIGQCACEEYKLNIYFNVFQYCNFRHHTFNPTEKLSPTILDKSRLKFSFPAKETLFQQEQLDVGHLCIDVPIEQEEKFLNHLIIDMVLFYRGGGDELAYVPSKNEYIKERTEIYKRIREIGTS